jgi:DNA-binding XRE family transcriptional regulator
MESGCTDTDVDGTGVHERRSSTETFIFRGVLERAGITKAELARRLGLNSRTVSAWGEEVPRYALAYLELLIAYNRVRP